jgi:hypothetical protein
MELLLKKGFYTETTYWDNQAMCDQQIPVVAFSYGMKVNFNGNLVSAFTAFPRTRQDDILVRQSYFLRA